MTLAPGVVCVNVDLDAPIDYCRFYRVAEEPPSDPFLDESLGFFLDVLAELGVRATFFAIARDCAGPAARRRLRQLVAAGHEIANHSLSHPHAFRRLPRAQKVAEIDVAKARLEEAAGAPVVGFRSPAYDLDGELLDLLLERGYLYDSSLNPTPFLLPMKWAVQLKARRWRVGLGRFLHGFAERRPHLCWRQDGKVRCGPRAGGRPTLVELPITVLPWLRFPFYGTITQVLGPRLFPLALAAARAGGQAINYGMHAAEVAPLMARDVAGRGGLVPGYGSPVESRRAWVRESLRLLCAGAEGITLAELAGRVSGAAGGEP